MQFKRWKRKRRKSIKIKYDQVQTEQAIKDFLFKGGKIEILEPGPDEFEWSPPKVEVMT